MRYGEGVWGRAMGVKARVEILGSQQPMGRQEVIFLLSSGSREGFILDLYPFP